MRATVTKITVEHSDPKPVEKSTGLYTMSFWLVLKVDTGDMVGEGYSPRVPVTLHKETLEEARLAAFVLGEWAEKKIQKLGLDQVLTIFPRLIEEGSSQEE